MGRVYGCYKILDHFSDFGNDWTRNIKIKVMLPKFFTKKKILIYGLGLSGNSCLKFLKKKVLLKYLMTTIY